MKIRVLWITEKSRLVRKQCLPSSRLHGNPGIPIWSSHLSTIDLNMSTGRWHGPQQQSQDSLHYSCRPIPFYGMLLGSKMLPQPFRGLWRQFWGNERETSPCFKRHVYGLVNSCTHSRILDKSGSITEQIQEIHGSVYCQICNQFGCMLRSYFPCSSHLLTWQVIFSGDIHTFVPLPFWSSC